MNLFIYIPTYNRPGALRTQLVVLAKQAFRFKNRVRILISDNASPNNTYEELVKEFSTENLRFRRNPGNIGGNANIALGFVFANRDEFLWILSDNDIVTTDAVEYILSHISDDIDFYYLAEGLEEEQEIFYDWKSGWEGPLNGLGLISAGLYNMSKVSPCIDNAFYFHNSSFPHLAVAFATARYYSRVKFKMVPRKIVIQREHSFSEFPGDYSLSFVGMPLLSNLMPSGKSKIFAWGWLRNYGRQFFTNRTRYKIIFLQSLLLMSSYGIKFQIVLFFFWMMDILGLHDIRKKIKSKIKE